MTETKETVSKFDDKLHKLIKRAKKQRGLHWPALVSKLEATSKKSSKRP
jgi:hypothetical protein